jgi:hypothetical protein
LVAVNVHHLQVTLDRPWNVNVVQKPLSAQKLLTKSLTKHFSHFNSGFTKLHAKLDADTLLDFAIHCTQNETRSR